MLGVSKQVRHPDLRVRLPALNPEKSALIKDLRRYLRRRPDTSHLRSGGENAILILQAEQVKKNPGSTVARLKGYNQP